MALQSVLYDARGNELASSFPDGVTGQTVTDLRTLTVSLGSLNAETFTDLNGASVMSVDVRSAAAALTFVIEGTVDGVNYYQLAFYDVQNRGVPLFSRAVTTTIGTSHYVRVAGFKRVRCRVSAYTSGAVTVALRSSVAEGPDSITPIFPTSLWVTATAAAASGATATLPAAGAGLYHYITHIDITRNATAALAGTATLIHTTTNLPGSPAWSVGNAMIAGGTQLDIGIDFTAPLKSSVANTNTTVVAAAAGAAVLVRVNVGYYIGL